MDRIEQSFTFRVDLVLRLEELPAGSTWTGSIGTWPALSMEVFRCLLMSSYMFTTSITSSLSRKEIVWSASTSRVSSPSTTRRLSNFCRRPDPPSPFSSPSCGERERRGFLRAFAKPYAHILVIELCGIGIKLKQADVQCSQTQHFRCFPCPPHKTTERPICCSCQKSKACYQIFFKSSEHEKQWQWKTKNLNEC